MSAQRADTRLRLGLGAVGVLVGGYGGYLLLEGTDASQLRGVGTWLVGGVVLHDAVLSALLVVAGFLITRFVPATARGPVAVGAIVLGSLTLLAVPVLGRFGAKPDNPSLLDRDYGLGWIVLALLVAAGVVGAILVRTRRRGSAEGD